MSWTAGIEAEQVSIEQSFLQSHGRWAAASAILLALVSGSLLSAGAELIDFNPLRLDHLAFLCAVLLGSAAVYRKPELGLLLLIALLYSNASEVAVRYHGLPSLLQGLGLLLILVVFGRHFDDPGEKLQTCVQLLLLAAYCFVVFVSSAKAINPSLADRKLLEQLKGLLTFGLVINLVRSRSTLDRSIWTVLLVGAALGTISSLQAFTSSYNWDFGGFGRIKDAQIVGDLRHPRVSGPFADPNFYAQMLIPLVPIALCRLWSEKNMWRKLLGAFCAAACLAALVFTYSRGAVLALALMSAVTLVLLRPRLKHWLAGVALLGLVLTFAPQEFEQRLATLNQFVDEQNSSASTDSSFRQRALLMRAAWEMWREYPIFGVGAGNYPEHYQAFADRIGSTVSSYEEFGEHRFAHCLYLETGAETGLAGILIFVAIIVATAIDGVKSVRRFAKLGDLKTARVVASLLVGLLGYLATSVFLHAGYPRHFWLLLALVAASSRVARQAVCATQGGAAA